MTGVVQSFDDAPLKKFTALSTMLIEQYEQENRIGSANMRQIEKQIMLYITDAKWKDHLYMDHLKEGIGLRGYGQQDPLLVYQRETSRILKNS